VTAAVVVLSADGTSIGGRRHVRRSTQEGRHVVRKARRSAHGMHRRGLFLEASLHSDAAARFASWRQPPVDPPLWCTDTVLTTAFYDDMVTAESFFGKPHLLTAVATRLGTAIAWLHTAERQRVEELPPAAIEAPPLAPIPLAIVAEQSGATLELAALLHREAFAELLEGVERPEQPDVFVHGDLKFDNVLTDSAGSGMKIIDWECAGRGAAIIDLAAFSASLIYEGVRLGAVDAELSARQGLQRADAETTKAWAAISAFVASYREGTGLAYVPVNPLVRLCARFLLARATSYTDAVGAFDRLPKILVRVAHNMVTKPELFERRFR
jgi:Phosphotransferase enzyme family